MTSKVTEQLFTDLFANSIMATAIANEEFKS